MTCIAVFGVAVYKTYLVRSLFADRAEPSSCVRNTYAQGVTKIERQERWHLPEGKPI